MEPEVHIVERYMQLVQRCCTMTNIMLAGGKEIDLLAFNPKTAERFHIEVRVCIGRGFRLRMVDTQTRSGQKHRRGMDTLSAIKFSPPTVIAAVSEVFGNREYHKVLVVWDLENTDVIEQTKALYGIEIWRMPDILEELLGLIGTKAYRDDVLRTVQLISMRNPAI
ncbi:MAG: hypothetical protein NWF05_11005 [Candidatus Bathyarchaeota archaeon]|nr:hypothetical protein [Candidatus Bathyarchaeota archaeon]